MKSRLHVALVLLLMAAAPAARAATFVVTDPADAPDALLSDDLCDKGTGECTLRAAIEQANATPGADRIEFAIPQPAPVLIRADSPLDLLDAVAIDATTQPGASVNTAAVGTNAVFGVELIGVSGVEIRVAAPNVDLRGFSIRGTGSQGVSPCVDFQPGSTGSRFLGNSVFNCVNGGIRVDADRVRIGDLALASRNVIGAANTGIAVPGHDNFIVNNLIGTDASGVLAVPIFGRGLDLAGDGNAVTDNVISASNFGVVIEGDRNTLLRNRIGGSPAFSLGNSYGIQVMGSSNRIGLPSASFANANEIAGNVTGIQISAPSNDNFVEGNRIGRPFANTGPALQIFSSSRNAITGNEITTNFAGVSVIDSVSGPAIDNAIRSNRIWSNGQYNLKLGTSGSPHDDATFGLPPDYDEGPNHLQNPPHITSVSITQGQTTIEGYIDANAGAYGLDFHSNGVCRGTPEGEFQLGAAPLNATGSATSPRTTFTVILPVTAQGRGFTATATDANGNTSEFGACFSAAVAGGADLVISAPPLAANPRALDPGDAVRLSLRLENRGPFIANAIPVVVSASAGFLSAWTPDPANASRFDAATGTWTVPSLGVGSVAQLDLDASLLPTAVGGFDVRADALLGLAEYDPNGLDNTVLQRGFVRSGADLVVSQVAPASAQDDDVVSFDITVTNTGPEDALSVRAAGRLDAGLSFEGSSSPSLRALQSVSTGQWTWSWAPGDLADRASATVRVDARIHAASAPDYGLEHVVSAVAASPADPLPSLSTRVVGLGRVADALVGSIEAFAPLIVSQTVSVPSAFGVNVANNGPDGLGRIVLRVDSCGAERLRLAPNPGASIRPISGGQPMCPSGAEAAIPCPLVCELSTGTYLASQGTVWIYFERDVSRIGANPTARVQASPGEPFYDPDPSNDSRTRVVSIAGALQHFSCGLLGIEAPILLGLLVLTRGRKGRAAFRRIFPGSAVAVALLVGASAESAHAIPIRLAVDSSASSATVAITSSLGSPAPVAVSLSGIVDADVTLTSDALFGLVAESLQLSGGAIAFSNSSIVLESFPLHDLTFSWNGIVAGVAGPAASGFPVAPGLSLFDLVGSSLSFGAGTIDATGSYFGLPVAETLDLAALPFGSTFPANSVARLEVSDLGGGVAALRLTLPFTATLRLTIDTQPVTVTIAGTLVLAGQSVPEPSAALLLGAAGALGLAFWSERWVCHRN